MKFICIDTETSGLDPETSEILELSYQHWCDFKRGTMQSDKFRALSNQQHPDFVGAQKINGYDDSKRNDLPVFQAGFVVSCFKAIEEAEGVVVGANPAFDWGMLSTWAKRLRVPFPSCRVRLIDVSSLAAPMVATGKVASYSLKDLVKLVGKEQPAVHTSAGDVELTIDVFEALCRGYVKALVSP
jgi:DNA polymerase III epsilon subunit-like protein